MSDARPTLGVPQQQVRGFAKYNREFNLSLFNKIATLDDGARKKDMGAFFGSIHGTLNHILLADRIWLGRFSTAMSGISALGGAALIHEFSSLRQELCSDFDALFHERRATDAVITSWADELTDESLAQSMSYRTSTGRLYEHSVWVAVAHMFNHQTHHRGQMTTLLYQLGIDPGVTDFVAYARGT